MVDIMMPWWGWGYLLFVLLMFVIGFISKEYNNYHEISGSVLSLFSICVFVLGFFNAEIVEFLGVLIIFMTAIGIYWEFTRAIIGTKRAEIKLAKEVVLSEEERKALLDFAIALNALMVVPAYITGLVLSFGVLRGFIGA